MAEKTCLFCGTSLAGTRSLEHVLPLWLIEYLGVSDEEMTPTHMNAAGELLSTRRHTPRNLVEGNVCSKCNNGWMSSLENQVISIVISLMEGDRVVVDLNEEERFRVSRWASKTVYVLNSSSNFRDIVPLEHFRHLYLDPDSLPRFVTVVAQQHHGESPFYWIQSPSWIAHCPSGQVKPSEIAELSKPSYKVTLQLKKLLIVVAYWPWSDWRMVLWPGIHVPLWPVRGPVAYHASDPLEDGFPWEDSKLALIAFHMTLGVMAPRSD